MFDYRSLGVILLGVGLLLVGYGLYISFSLTEKVVEKVSGHHVEPLHKAAVVIGGALMMMVGWLLTLSKPNSKG